jgi:hypothetical protein
VEDVGRDRGGDKGRGPGGEEGRGRVCLRGACEWGEGGLGAGAWHALGVEPFGVKAQQPARGLTHPQGEPLMSAEKDG